MPEHANPANVKVFCLAVKSGTEKDVAERLRSVASLLDGMWQGQLLVDDNAIGQTEEGVDFDYAVYEHDIVSLCATPPKKETP